MDSSATSPRTDRLSVLGVAIDNVTMAQCLDQLSSWADHREPRLVAFVNAACLNIATEDEEYRRILGGCDLVLPDGIGVRLAGRMHGVQIVDNVNGTDLFPRLCERAALEGRGLYLLGSADGVAAGAARVMEDRYPGLRIVGTHHGYFTPEDEDDVLASINASGADYLLVAMGVPQQEKWLHRVADRLDVPVRLGVGALFDITSGRVARAPRALRSARLEWLWRLAMEPRRMWRRYVVGNPLFLSRAYRDSRSTPTPSTQEPS